MISLPLVVLMRFTETMWLGRGGWLVPVTSGSSLTLLLSHSALNYQWYSALGPKRRDSLRIGVCRDKGAETGQVKESALSLPGEVTNGPFAYIKGRTRRVLCPSPLI